MNGVTTVYIGKLYECTAGNCTKYFFAGGSRVAMKSGTQTYYYHTDHLGSSVMVTDAGGTVIQNLAYNPFGQVRTNSATATTPDAHHKFTGQELDDSTGLYFYGARYYDPVLARFTQADTVIPNHTNPQSLNRYSYVDNNPLNYTDPTGHFKLRNFLRAAGKIGVVVGAVVAIGICPECAAFVAPLVGAVAGGALAALDGGDMRAVYQGAFIGLIAGAVGGGIGGSIGQIGALGSFAGYAGAIVGAGAGGYTQGFGAAYSAGARGRYAIRAGYQGAVTGAASAVAFIALDNSCNNCLTKSGQAKASTTADQAPTPQVDQSEDPDATLVQRGGPPRLGPNARIEKFAESYADYLESLGDPDYSLLERNLKAFYADANRIASTIPSGTFVYGVAVLDMSTYSYGGIVVGPGIYSPYTIRYPIRIYGTGGAF